MCVCPEYSRSINPDDDFSADHARKLFVLILVFFFLKIRRGYVI